MERIRWEGQNFFEVVAPQEEEDAHTSAASSRLNWRPRRFKWTRSFRRKTESGFCACAIMFQTYYTTYPVLMSVKWGWTGAVISRKSNFQQIDLQCLTYRLPAQCRTPLASNKTQHIYNAQHASSWHSWAVWSLQTSITFERPITPLYPVQAVCGDHVRPSEM
jgi:hypothetical protein